MDKENDVLVLACKAALKALDATCDYLANDDHARHCYGCDMAPCRCYVTLCPQARDKIRAALELLTR